MKPKLIFAVGLAALFLLLSVMDASACGKGRRGGRRGGCGGGGGESGCASGSCGSGGYMIESCPGGTCPTPAKRASVACTCGAKDCNHAADCPCTAAGCTCRPAANANQVTQFLPASCANGACNISARRVRIVEAAPANYFVPGRTYFYSGGCANGSCGR